MHDVKVGGNIFARMKLQHDTLYVTASAGFLLSAMFVLHLQRGHVAISSATFCAGTLSPVTVVALGTSHGRRWSVPPRTRA